MRKVIYVETFKKNMIGVKAKKQAGVFLFFLIGINLPSVGMAKLKLKEAGWCNYRATYDCVNCKSPIYLSCVSVKTKPKDRKYGGVDMAQGYVSRQAELDQLIVLVTSEDGQQRKVTVSNPPGKLDDYIDGIQNNKWIIDRIEGFQSGDKIEVAFDGYGLKSSTEMFNNIDGARFTAPMSIGSATQGDFPIEKCWYTEPPMVIGSEKCRDKICYGSIECSFDDIVYSDLKITCRAEEERQQLLIGSHTNRNCPKPDECIRQTNNERSRVIWWKDRVWAVPASNHADLGGVVDMGPKPPKDTGSSSGGSAPVESGDSGVVQ